MSGPNERAEGLRRAAREYFGQPGFARFLALLRAKYEASRAGARGTIALTGLTETEREALDGFYGTYTPVRPSASGAGTDAALKYSIARFEKLLLASRFAMAVPELFEALDGASLYTRAEMQAEEEAAWQALIQQERAALEAGLGLSGHRYGHRIAEWVSGLGTGTSPGSRTLRLAFAMQRAAAADCLRDCVRALLAAAKHRRQDACDAPSGAEGHAPAGAPDHTTDRTPLPLRLPVLAARITGDAHALDWKQPLGRLFWWGLVAVFHEREEELTSLAARELDEQARGAADGLAGESTGAGAMETAAGQEWAADEPGYAAESTATAGLEEDMRNLSRALLIREGYRMGGIADDDLSSQVMFFSPGWYDAWEERVLTLRQVEKLKPDEVERIRPSAVYAVENPSVFAVLVDEAVRRYGSRRPRFSPGGGRDLPMLVCGNGQPSVAVVQLLKLFLEPATAPPPPLYYSGDLDVAGLEIARSLQQRFPNSFRAWRMDAEWFSRHASRGFPMTAAERERMARLTTLWDGLLPGTAAASGMKLHQELWVDTLAEDWQSALSRNLSHEGIDKLE
ncbi:TIGR02679 domain-containing protein [Cohnella nanjingensis]|uniref:DUF2399 domain-containing protein n=1 Tax=Cohnella nanjingensis TaxID=1387779 RepID=A0A7X0VFM0_9BACL|nr:TIGR02679 domain-containing protein [Cohnella nanjingensis]MBB6672187.1 DUF2399 domain-containing protein [Cohnella nanjingensis]